MRLAVRFSKGDPVRFVSHLDVQRLFQRAFRRAKLPLAYSQGFNPHPLVSFATALSVGFTSRGEYLDLILTQDMTPEEFCAAASPYMPEGVKIEEVIDLGGSKKSLTSAMRSASYTVKTVFDEPMELSKLNSAIDSLLSGEIVVQKKTKGGIKPTDIRPMVYELSAASCTGVNAELRIRGQLTAEGGLNPDMLLRELWTRLGTKGSADIERTVIEMDMDSILS